MLGGQFSLAHWGQFVWYLQYTKAKTDLIDENGKTAYDMAFSNQKYPATLLISKYLGGYNFHQLIALNDSINEEEKYYKLGDSCVNKYDTSCALKNFNIRLIYSMQLYGRKSPDYATCLNNIANLYKSMGNFKEALRYFKEDLEITREVLGTRHPDYATSLDDIAGLYMIISDYGEALSIFNEALKIRKEVLGIHHPDYATSLNNLAGLYLTQGNYSEALPLFKEALQIRKLAKDSNPLYYTISLNNLAQLHKSMGNFEDALPLFKEALAIRKEVLGLKHPYFATSLNNLATLFMSMGNYTDALPLLKDALQIRKEKLGMKHPDYGTSLNNLAEVLEFMGNYSEALLLFKEDLEITKEALGPKHPAYATILNNIAELYRTLGNYTQALQLFNEALVIKKDVLGIKHPDYASSLNNLALLNNSMGNYAEALLLYKKSLTIRKSVLGTQHPDYANTLNNIASLYQSIGNYTDAISLFKEALVIRKETLGKNHPDYATTLNNIANVYKLTGNYSEALTFYLEALEIKKKVVGTKHTDYAICLNNLAELYIVGGNLIKAESLLTEALAIRKQTLGLDHPDYASVLNNLAALYESKKNYIDAYALFQEALAIKKARLGVKHPDYLTSLVNLAALQIIMGKTEIGISNLNTANTILLANINEYSRFTEVKKLQNWFESIYFNYRILFSAASFYKSPELVSTSINSLLTFKGMGLKNRSILYSIMGQTKDTVLINLANQFFQAWVLLGKQIEQNKNKLFTDSLENLLTGLEEELIRRSPEYQSEVADRQIDWHIVQQRLKPNEVAIEFADFLYWDKHWTETTLYAAFIIKSEGEPQLIQLCRKEDLEKRINDTIGKRADYVKKLYDNEGTAFLESGKASIPTLYQLIWKPLDSVLKGVTTVYVAPSGLLHRINFAAIATTSKTVLGEKYQFHLLGSTRDVVNYQILDISVNTENLLLYGGIKYHMNSTSLRLNHNNYNKDTTDIVEANTRLDDFSYLKELQYSGEEVAEIEKLAQKNKYRYQLFTDLNATEESFKYYTSQSQSPVLVHIATHGFFVPDEVSNKVLSKEKTIPYFIGSPNVFFRSGLFFAGANQVVTGKKPVEGIEDGIVTAYDIISANLQKTKLMVLSSCESGLGKIQNTEGVYGLQRAIRMAGCKNLIMSLWQVNDAAAKEFMDYFYTHLLKEKETIYDSYQYAQDQMRKNHPGDPYRWAAFVLME